MDKREDLLVNVVVFDIATELEGIGDGCSESWFRKEMPGPPFELLSTTSINSVNCLVKNGVLSP